MRTNADDASNYLVIMTEYAYKMRMVVACNEVTEREREARVRAAHDPWFKLCPPSSRLFTEPCCESHASGFAWICVCHIFINDVESTAQIWRVSLTCSDSDIFQWFGTFRNHVRDLPCKSHGCSNATVVAQRRQCWCQASSARVHNQLIYKWIHSPLNQGGVTELLQLGALCGWCAHDIGGETLLNPSNYQPKVNYFRHEITRPFLRQSSRWCFSMFFPWELQFVVRQSRSWEMYWWKALEHLRGCRAFVSYFRFPPENQERKEIIDWLYAHNCHITT